MSLVKDKHAYDLSLPGAGLLHVTLQDTGSMVHCH